MTHAQPIITASRVEAYVASALRLLGWLLGVILRIGASGRGARLKHVLSRAERAVECILFLKAVALYGPPPQRRRHPRAAPHGFRRIVRKGGSFFRSVKIRAHKAGALTRVLALIDALTRPARAVAYFLKQICKGLRLAGLLPVAPPADAFAEGASFAVRPFADTS
jgi:hypothetical protein